MLLFINNYYLFKHLLKKQNYLNKAILSLISGLNFKNKKEEEEGEERAKRRKKEERKKETPTQHITAQHNSLTQDVQIFQAV